MIRYYNFRLKIEAAGEGKFRVHADSPSGQDSAPIDAEKITRCLGLKGLPGRSPQWDALMWPEDPRKLGERLFRLVMPEPVRYLWEHAQGRLQERPGRRLRLQIAIENHPRLNWLHEVPWELLYNLERGTFLGLNSRFSLVRFIESPVPEQPLGAPGPLRVLIVASQAADLPPLKLEHEKRVIRKAVEGNGGISLKILNNPAADGLREVLLSQRFHVLHFMGHGMFDPERREGGLMMEGRQGRSEFVGSEVLATLLQGVDQPKLVVLNACESPHHPIHAEPFHGVAQALVLAGIPAVVAMRRPVLDWAALQFAKAFYRRLSAGDSLDEAMIQGRGTVFGHPHDTAEWAVPALFMRVNNSRLFDFRRQQSSRSRAAELEADMEIGDIEGDVELVNLELTRNRRASDRGRASGRMSIGKISGRQHKLTNVKD